MRVPRLLLPALVLLILVRAALAQAPTPKPFEIVDGDRVLFLGDVLLERENTYGALETRMTEQFADRRFTVRNLSWSGETPLGVARASFDPPAKGWERLKEQIAETKPTVAFLGFGMAASLQELADVSHDIMLNPDATRYGREPMSVARFKTELGQCVDEVTKAGATRIVLLSPLAHEDLRQEHSGFPRNEAHEKLLIAYSQAIGQLAQERGVSFVSLRELTAAGSQHLTSNGIHLTAPGYDRTASWIGGKLGWGKGEPGPTHELLRQAIVRKNQLFFYRFRPSNYTYLFGFRNKEQGQNAKEIPMFDPLIAQAEREIAELAQGRTVPPPVEPASFVKRDPVPPAPPAEPAPLPTFDVQEGFQIDLWATNPLLEKPVQMNWDSEGRLWIASSSTYPQVNPEDVAAMLAKETAGRKEGPSAGNDKIIVIEATKPGGVPDKSTVFAEGLLIPTGVAPFRTKEGHWGCYVGQSTELLELVDTDGDGKADRRRVILSGFGTEDTHHLVHTLKWGPDGQLYFDQSIYIHSHLETPWGLVRLNSGGILSWDPETERVDVHEKGFCNPWGHIWDREGNSFITDGAGFQGVSWGVQGGMYFTYENGRKIMPSVSPGSYPKFASLEIIDSPHFPVDWQGSLITCDFRAHRVVHFGLNDLAKNTPPASGFVTTELPDLVRTGDVSFRPIDARMGPDGALYVADWSNPVINHGEVDFRDPRRDHHQGRIWKITRKGAPAFAWQKLSDLPNHELVRALTGGVNAWTVQQASQELRRREVEVLPFSATRNTIDPRTPGIAESDLQLASFSQNANPRVRLEAMRTLARLPSLPNVDLVLAAALQTPPSDPYYEYAAWLSINDLAEVWTKAVLSGEWKPDTDARQRQIEWALNALDPEISGPVLAKVLAAGEITLNSGGPWIELLGQAGGAQELGELLKLLVADNTDPSLRGRAAVALREAMRLRKLKPAGDLPAVERLLEKPDAAFAPEVARLVTVWRTPKASLLLIQVARGTGPEPLRAAAIDGLRELGGADAVATLRELSAQRPPQGMARAATVALAALDLRGSFTQIAALLGDLATDNERVDTWRALLATKGVPDGVAALAIKAGAGLTLSPAAQATGLRVARELGKGGAKLVAALSPAGDPSLAAQAAVKDYSALLTLVPRDGDPAQGEEIYRRAALLCTTCHAIGGAGGKVGPDLTSIGASAPLDYIIESVLAPALKVKEGFHAVSITLKDGNVTMGIPSRETADELFLRNVAGQETPVVKATIASKEVIGSIMPAGLVDALPQREQMHLYSFLSRLGKPGPYDASKGNVARYWALYPGATLEGALHGQALPEGAAPGYTLVDGRLTRELLQGALPLVPKAGDSVLAVARFQLPSGGETRLNFTGATEAWLDGQPWSLAAEAAPSNLPAGEHTVVVRLNTKQPPTVLRLECPTARFLGN